MGNLGWKRGPRSGSYHVGQGSGLSRFTKHVTLPPVIPLGIGQQSRIKRYIK